MNIGFIFLYQPLINLLFFLYQVFAGNLGLAIIALTVLLRLALIPLTNPSMESAKKMQELQPELEKLKKTYKDDKQALAKAQMELYRQHNINPLGSLLPTILQFIVLIALFRVFIDVLNVNTTISSLNENLYPFLHLNPNTTINFNFLSLDLTQPDTYVLPNNFGFLAGKKIPGAFLLLAAVSQYLSSLLMMKSRSQKQKSVVSQKTKNSNVDMASSMQKQMLIMMPFLTLLIGLRFASGLVLYWIAFSVVMSIQQLLVNKKVEK